MSFKGGTRYERGTKPMSESNPIRVFVTHAFDESENYLRVFEFLESVDRFYYLNMSRPDASPEGGMDAVKEQLLAQIKSAEVVFVMPDLYHGQPAMVNFMMDAADANNIPMIVIQPFGQLGDTPPELIARCQEHIAWNARALADALKRQARHKEARRYDSIDFPGWDESGEIDETKQ